MARKIIQPGQAALRLLSGLAVEHCPAQQQTLPFRESCYPRAALCLTSEYTIRLLHSFCAPDLPHRLPHRQFGTCSAAVAPSAFGAAAAVPFSALPGVPGPAPALSALISQSAMNSSGFSGRSFTTACSQIEGEGFTDCDRNLLADLVQRMMHHPQR